VHTGSYGLMSGDGAAQVAAPGGQEGSTATWPVWSGPVPPLAEGFTVRPDTVPGLEAALTPGATLALVPEQVPATAKDWRASSGKTQLARYFAESLWRSPGVDVLTWVVATSRASVLAGFVQAAAAMGGGDAGDAETVAARYADWLSKTSRPWLVVLDDLRDAADLDGLWPAGPAGRVLITTANPAAVPGEWRALALPVPAFSTREAMGFLSGRLSTDPEQRSGAIDLVRDLGCEPIALAQASAVIATSGMSCRNYRQHFTQRQKQLVEAGRVEPSAAAVTWTFSAEYAEHLSPGVSIRSLLALAAQLDGHGIPGPVFTTQAVSQYLAEDGAARAGHLAADPQRTWNAIVSLRQAGLMTVDPPGTPPAVRISRVVQAVIRAAVPDDVYDRAALAAADALLEMWPEEEPRSRLAADMRACATSLRRNAGDVLWADGRCHPVLVLAGQSMDRAGLTGPAVGYWRELTAASERILGQGSLETLAVTGYLGEALMTAGQAAEAVAWFQRILDGRSGVLGPDHPDAIAAKVCLGRALMAVGRADDAVIILEEAVGGSELVRGADHIATLAAREEYAAAARAAGKSAEAIRSYRHSLADRERILGAQHPDTMAAGLGLADTYLAAGQTKDAIAQYKRVLADREGTLGPDHADTLQARSSLAAANFTAGRMGAALQLYEESSEGYERTIGAEHPTTLACQAELARGYYATGRLGDALALLSSIIARAEWSLPPGDPMTANMRETLARITK
jgi:tetratricopeptide (TPR) repeat protein